MTADERRAAALALVARTTEAQGLPLVLEDTTVANAVAAVIRVALDRDGAQ